MHPQHPQRIEPGPGQESVWDYPRPPALEESDKHVQIRLQDLAIVDSHRTKRVLETSHPPVYYIPPEDIDFTHLQSTEKASFCEWKGIARYYSVAINGKVLNNVAWYYPEPTERFQGIANYLAFYPSVFDCFLDGQPVQAQSGDFYGGWITPEIVGPFKGGTGTWGW